MNFLPPTKSNQAVTHFIAAKQKVGYLSGVRFLVLNLFELLMPSSKILSTSFNYQGVYPCPVCRVGKISHMPLMEAMSCDFCQQIFVVNVEQQQLKMPSRQPPLIWYWNGFNWTEAQIEGVEFGWGYVLAAVCFILFPTALIGIVAYNFPPQTQVPLSWVPYIWTALTFSFHLAIIVWLLIEVYQIPMQAYVRALQQRFLSRG